MPLRGNHRAESRGIDWLALVRTALLQVLILLALAGAVVRYLSWSSDTNWAEFLAAGESSAAAATRHQPPPAIPAQPVKSKVPCDPRI
jgi:hypothetical protein